jgi:hypothetical protein
MHDLQRRVEVSAAAMVVAPRDDVVVLAAARSQT